MNASMHVNTGEYIEFTNSFIFTANIPGCGQDVPRNTIVPESPHSPSAPVLEQSEINETTSSPAQGIPCYLHNLRADCDLHKYD